MNITDVLYVFLLSLLPYFEGRYAFLVSMALGHSIQTAVTITILGTLLLSIALPVLLGRLDAFLTRTSIRLLRRLYESTVSRARRKAERYAKASLLVLLAFVAVPLPGSGVWTGSLIAYILGIPRRAVIPVLACGGVLSVVIVALAYLLGLQAIERLAFK